MQRRTLLGVGVAGAALLTLAGGGLALLRPGLRDGRLAPAGRELFGAVAEAVLDGVLPVALPARRDAIDAHLSRLDVTVATLAPTARTELSQLVALLHSGPGRLAMCGMAANWADASKAEVQSALQAMRSSRLELRQQAYHALRDLTNAAYFADAATWAALGYPGPRSLS
jgi:hypothetical protein